MSEYSTRIERLRQSPPRLGITARQDPHGRLSNGTQGNSSERIQAALDA